MLFYGCNNCPGWRCSETILIGKTVVCRIFRYLFIVEVSKPCTNSWLWVQRSHRGGEHERISTRATAGGTEFEGFPSGKLVDANWIPVL